MSCPGLSSSLGVMVVFSGCVIRSGIIVLWHKLLSFGPHLPIFLSLDPVLSFNLFNCWGSKKRLMVHFFSLIFRGGWGWQIMQGDVLVFSATGQSKLPGFLSSATGFGFEKGKSGIWSLFPLNYQTCEDIVWLKEPRGR